MTTLSDLIARLEANLEDWQHSRDFHIELADRCLSHEGSRQHNRDAARFHGYVVDAEIKLAVLKAREAGR